MKLNCITVDDEPLALQLINSYIERTPGLILTGSYHHATEAIESHRQQQVHLIFLDIHMPGLNGIELAHRIIKTHEANRPRIVFSTAYSQFAVESYKLDALDYLLKPFEYEDFLRTVQKGLLHFEHQHAIREHSEEVIYVRNGHQQIRVLLHDIRYIQGMKDYAVIHLKDSEKSVIALSTLKSLNEKLPSDRFMRVQRSYIVANDSITAAATNHVWINELKIRVGEQYRSAVRKHFRDGDQKY